MGRRGPLRGVHPETPHRRPMNSHMIDRVLAGALNFVIVGMIALLSAASLACGHWGALRMLSGNWTGGGVLLGVAAVFAVATWLLIRNRNDLVDR